MPACISETTFAHQANSVGNCNVVLPVPTLTSSQKSQVSGSHSMGCLARSVFLPGATQQCVCRDSGTIRVFRLPAALRPGGLASLGGSLSAQAEHASQVVSKSQGNTFPFSWLLWIKVGWRQSTNTPAAVEIVVQLCADEALQ